MGNSDKKEETRRNSLSDSAHNNAPNSSTVKEGCSEKYKNVENYIKQHFDIVPNGVTLDDAEVIFFGEIHSNDYEIKRSQIKIRNTILLHLTSPQDTLLVEGMSPTDFMKMDETDPVLLGSGSPAAAMHKLYTPGFSKGGAIMGWDNMEEQAKFKVSLEKTGELLKERNLLLERAGQIKIEMGETKDEDTQGKLMKELRQLNDSLDESRPVVEFHHQRVKDSFTNRNKSMIDCIQKFSRPDKRVFILTGQKHFDPSEPRNDELKASLQGKKVLYLVEKKREVKEGQPGYNEQYTGTD